VRPCPRMHCQDDPGFEPTTPIGPRGWYNDDVYKAGESCLLEAEALTNVLGTARSLTLLKTTNLYNYVSSLITSQPNIYGAYVTEFCNSLVLLVSKLQ
jgi:hypothetical protein